MTNQVAKKEKKDSFGKLLLLGVQHVFAMFGATVVVPLLTGMDPAVALLCAGVGTWIFHLCTGRKVPTYLGSSFAFIAAIQGAAAMCAIRRTRPHLVFLFRQYRLKSSTLLVTSNVGQAKGYNRLSVFLLFVHSSLRSSFFSNLGCPTCPGSSVRNSECFWSQPTLVVLFA